MKKPRNKTKVLDLALKYGYECVKLEPTNLVEKFEENSFDTCYSKLLAFLNI